MGGGVLMKDQDGAVVGAVGVSGRTAEEDIEVAVRLVDKIKAKAGI
ncbi:MAG: heme-binding protein [Deltaproteobacteria bacterium]|nr:heme-binding protein [Deltaproteobacteria bacterium]